MAAVYPAIAAFENSVGDFVARQLLEGLPPRENWWQECVSERIRKKAESRQEEEAKFGDLTSIIWQNWNLFEPTSETKIWFAKS